MALIPIWATTLMVQNETVYINIYMKLKNIFSNSNRYFAVLIHYVHICYVYILYIYMYYIMLYIYIYVYIYNIYQGFPYWGIGGNTPNNQMFAHSLRTSNNFFFHQ